MEPNDVPCPKCKQLQLTACHKCTTLVYTCPECKPDVPTETGSGYHPNFECRFFDIAHQTLPTPYIPPRVPEKRPQSRPLFLPLLGVMTFAFVIAVATMWLIDVIRN